jgi:hypothetical protein
MDMAKLFSEAWATACEEAFNEDPKLQEILAGRYIRMEWHIPDLPGLDEDEVFAHHLVVDHGNVEWGLGPIRAPQAIIRYDWECAKKIWSRGIDPTDACEQGMFEILGDAKLPQRIIEIITEGVRVNRDKVKPEYEEPGVLAGAGRMNEERRHGYRV